MIKGNETSSNTLIDMGNDIYGTFYYLDECKNYLIYCFYTDSGH